jgi:hypothetical protein
LRAQALLESVTDITKIEKKTTNSQRNGKRKQSEKKARSGHSSSTGGRLDHNYQDAILDIIEVSRQDGHRHAHGCVRPVGTASLLNTCAAEELETHQSHSHLSLLIACMWYVVFLI